MDVSVSIISTENIPDGAITPAKKAALGQQISASTGFFATNNTTSFVDVTNLSVPITTTGRPVSIILIPETPYVGGSYINSEGNDNHVSFIRIMRDAVELCHFYIQGYTTSTAYFTPAAIAAIDIPAAGTYTYKIQGKYGSATNSLKFNAIKLMVYEL